MDQRLDDQGDNEPAEIAGQPDDRARGPASGPAMRSAAVITIGNAGRSRNPITVSATARTAE